MKAGFFIGGYDFCCRYIRISMKCFWSTKQREQEK
jgi:hypothetical protein